MAKIIKILAFIVLVLSLILNLRLYQENQVLQEQNVVTKVIDGDSFILASGQEVRLVNINSPEIAFCGGKEAKDRLSQLVLKKAARLDTVTHDNYNRLLSLVYVGDILVNKVLLEDGLVRYDSSPSPQKDQLLKISQVARDKKVGLFTSCVSDKPDKDGCLIKGNIERNTNIKRYHFQGCSNYQAVMVEKDLGEGWFCSEKEAEKAGFAKSPECYGKTYKPQ